MLNHAGVPVESFVEPSTRDLDRPNLICFSHLRWDFVFQRPQQLMSRFAEDMPVVFWEEPMDIGAHETPSLQVHEADGFPRVRVVVPQLPQGLGGEQRDASLKGLLDGFVSTLSGPLVAWYYTPMMLPFSRHLATNALVYDCMDELSKFRFAPEELLDLEQELISKADLVFTGGSSLFEAKKDRHESVHLFASSVDRDHFGKAACVRAEFVETSEDGPVDVHPDVLIDARAK